MRDLRGLKVCFLAGTLDRGGAERQLYYIVKTLIENGAHPRVLCMTTGEFWEAALRRLGVPVEWVGRRRSRLARVRTVIDAVRADPPHVLQSQHFHTNLYTAVAARVIGIAGVGAIRSSATWEVAEVGAVFGRLSLRVPRFVAANSRAAIANAAAWGAPTYRLRFLPNVVDTDAFAPAPRTSNGCIRVLTVGRRSPHKRLDRFLSVLAGVRRAARRPVCGLLVSPVNQAGALEARATDLGLSPDVLEFRMGAVDMAAVYRSADIFLLTSDSEGTPNVVLEAMAAATAIVATRVGGIPDIVQDGATGHLAEPGDVRALVDAVVALSENDEARTTMGSLARAYVERHHSLHGLSTVLGDFYESVNA